MMLALQFNFLFRYWLHIQFHSLDLALKLLLLFDITLDNAIKLLHLLFLQRQLLCYLSI